MSVGPDRLHAIVPAGGAGPRLWPLSRRARPKFLLDLTGSGRSLLQGTVDRLAPVSDSITVVTGRMHAPAVADQLGTDARIVPEPGPKDSMAAIGLAAAIIARDHGPEAVVGSFAADHLIGDRPAFERAVATAVAAARRDDVTLVTIGLTPTHPATGFGYIAVGAPLDPGEGTSADRPAGPTSAADGLPDAGPANRPVAHRADGFQEKPDAGTATAYLAGARHLWNAGMFVARAGALLDALRTEHPDLHDGLQAIAAVWGTEDEDDVLATTWPHLTAIAIDHALAEPLAARGRVAVVPADLDWTDIGDADSLATVLGAGTGTDADAVPDAGAGTHAAAGALAGAGAPAAGPAGAGVVAEPHTVVVGDDSPGAFVHAPGRVVALHGVPGAVVVDTGDALLVTTRDAAQGVGRVVTQLRDAGLGDLT
jgi:mannose-1-phosphate guanylyltransferase